MSVPNINATPFRCSMELKYENYANFNSSSGKDFSDYLLISEGIKSQMDRFNKRLK